MEKSKLAGGKEKRRSVQAVTSKNWIPLRRRQG